MSRALIALAVLMTAGCGGPPPAKVEGVRFYVAPGLPGALAADLARGFAIASPTLVDRVEDAEVAWLMDPVAALALGGRAAGGNAPEQPGVPDTMTDPKRRFAPVGAIAQVIVVAERRSEPFTPSDLRGLADPRVRGKVALVRFDRGEGSRLAAALELAYGERGVHGWLDRLAANKPVLLEREADVVARVASGEVPFGLTGSLTAGAAAQRDGLRVVFTDQKGTGCVVVPTALVVLPGASAGARRFSAWLAGPVAERVLVERVVGLLPLRADATAPKGMEPLSNLVVLALDWGALADRERIWSERLAAWPGLSPGAK